MYWSDYWSSFRNEYNKAKLNIYCFPGKSLREKKNPRKSLFYEIKIKNLAQSSFKNLFEIA